jgi:hypothetical protein
MGLSGKPLLFPNKKIKGLLFLLTTWLAYAKLHLHTDMTLEMMVIICSSLCQAISDFSTITCPQYMTRGASKRTTCMHHMTDRSGKPWQEQNTEENCWHQDSHPPTEPSELSVLSEISALPTSAPSDPPASPPASEHNTSSDCSSHNTPDNQITRHKIPHMNTCLHQLIYNHNNPHQITPP